MSYRVKFSAEAKRSLATLPGRYRQRVRRIIEGLSRQPQPAGAKPLRDRPGLYRLRLDGWRIIYQIDENAGYEAGALSITFGAQHPSPCALEKKYFHQTKERGDGQYHRNVQTNEHL